MSSIRWGFRLAAALVLSAATRGAAAEEADTKWSAREGQSIVIERQDGSRVEGKLLKVEPGSVEVQMSDGGRTVVERSVIKALRTKLQGQQVTVSMTESGETISGKLVEKDEKTIVIEKDDGARVTIERASIKTVRERVQAAPAAAPRAVSSGSRAVYPRSNSNDEDSREPEGTPWEKRPSTGRGALIAGGVFFGIGVNNLLTSALCKVDDVVPRNAQDLCLKVAVGVGGASAGLGLILAIVGVQQRSEYEAWKRKLLGFVPERGGGKLTFQLAF